MITAQQVRESTETANLIRIPREYREYFNGEDWPSSDHGGAFVKGFWDSRELTPVVSKHGSRRAYTIGKKAKKIVEIFVSENMYIEPDLNGDVKKDLEALEDENK